MTRKLTIGVLGVTLAVACTGGLAFGRGFGGGGHYFVVYRWADAILE